jgi:hypothetical protein
MKKRYGSFLPQRSANIFWCYAGRFGHAGKRVKVALVENVGSFGEPTPPAHKTREILPRSVIRSLSGRLLDAYLARGTQPSCV